MSQQHLSIQGLKSYYETLFNSCEAGSSAKGFISFLEKIIFDLAHDLDLDLSRMDKDFNDETLCKVRRLGPLESLRRCLLTVAEAANYKATSHPDWSLLAGRIEAQRLKLLVPETLEEMINTDKSIWRTDYYNFFVEHLSELEEMIVPERDLTFYFFGIRTLEKSYLMRIIKNGEYFLETPQRLYLRVATALWFPNLSLIKEYYDFLSQGLFTHASPTLFHAGIRKGAYASCYLLSIEDDLEKIYQCLGWCAQISKAAGGIGLDISKIRHSQIGHFGQSSGIVPMLKVFDATMRYVNQGGRRKGSATIFLQPWHIDFPDFIQLKRQHGKEELRVRDLFYSMWSCDLFMERVEKDQEWTMFCPKIVPKLNETHSDEFDEWYLHYEQTLKETMLPAEYDKCVRKMPARKVWYDLLTTQIDSGMPFMGHKDTANNTSNQENLGLIRSSNLCMEITEVTDGQTISSCNLASLALDEYVEYTVDGLAIYNFEKLGQVTRKVIRGINRVIDRTFYPLSKEDQEGPIESTNLKYRPTGLGVQALADTFMKMGLAWTDQEAKTLNRDIFATIYYHAVDESAKLAQEEGSYIGFDGSPASQGMLKFDLMARERARKDRRLDPDAGPIKELTAKYLQEYLSPMYDWEALRQTAKKGLRNSLLIALMPTASSAQIRYKNESFEPFTSNMYMRSVLSGNHIVVNRYMVSRLEKLNCWNTSIINHIISQEGSIQRLPVTLVSEDSQDELQKVKDMCKTAFELPQKRILELAIDRSFYVCQSQSLNVHKKDPTYAQLGALHMYAWKNCLTTGMYYLRTAPTTEAIKFTVEGELDVKKSIVCSDDVCLACQ